jgi:hypothetical protein
VYATLTRVSKLEARSDEARAEVVARINEAVERVSGMVARVHEVEVQASAALDMCAAHRLDLGGMAESLGTAFEQVRFTPPPFGDKSNGIIPSYS